MEKDYQYWVDKLDLQPHPEGGFFKETYRSSETIANDSLPDRFKGERHYSTAIYFLLTGANFSALHRINSDEGWHFYAGSGITIGMISPKGEASEIRLGSKPDEGEVFQAMVPAGHWFGSHLTAHEGWALVGCTVAPGFDFNDFEMGSRSELLSLFPQHQELIERLTRS